MTLFLPTAIAPLGRSIASDSLDGEHKS
jgi:hypothetical protein